MEEGQEEQTLNILAGVKEIPGVMQPKVMGARYDIYISGEILDSAQYIKTFDLIRNTTPNDVIFLHINSPGGDLYTAIQYMRVIKESESVVVCCAEGMVASAALLIFISGDTYSIADYSTFMAHTLSTGFYGKANELHDDISFTKTWGDNITKSAFAGFLTDNEITQIINGKNIWLTSDEVKKRIETKEKNMQKKEREQKQKIKKLEESPKTQV